MKSIAPLLAITAIAVNLIIFPACAQNRSDQIVLLKTSKGAIRMRIFYSMVPYTAGNFLDLVDSGFYNGLSFHRVENWVIQGGDPNGNGSGCATDPDSGRPKYLRLEVHPNLNHNQAGMVAMARGQDINSASCQFYILKSPAPFLNGKYAVFGRVLSGMEAVYAIRPGDRIISASIIQPNNNPNPAADNSPPPPEEPAAQQPVKPRESGF